MGTDLLTASFLHDSLASEIHGFSESPLHRAIIEGDQQRHKVILCRMRLNQSRPVSSQDTH
jgi:hypothetical protein